MDGSESAAVAGSVAFPVADQYGAQIDIVGGDINGSTTIGAAHLFWRDPHVGLVGLTGVYGDVDGVDVDRFGFEGELYQDNWTLAGGAGHQGGDIDDAAYVNLDARYYVNDNTLVEVGGWSADSTTGIHLGGEIALSDGLTLWGDAAAADEYDHVMVGVRYYFGGKKSLKRRHREDDPLNLGVMGATQANRSAQRVIEDRQTGVEQTCVPTPLNPCGGGGML